MEALAVSAASAFLGFPVPPTIAKSIFQAISALVDSAADVPVAWLQGKAQEIRAVSQAKAALTNRAVDLSLKTIGEDKELAERTARFLGARWLREQETRESVFQGAVDDLKANPPTEDASREVDQDWLQLFARHAETKTNTDVRAYFSRVLAGEIRKPGSFSPETIEVLARMAPQVGTLFQNFCGITSEVPPNFVAVFTDPFGDPGSNALRPLGFSYDVISRLQDAGLVRHDLGSCIEATPLALLPEASIGGSHWRLRVISEVPAAATRRQLNTIRLTVAAVELRRIVPNEMYVARFVEWAKQFGLAPG